MSNPTYRFFLAAVRVRGSAMFWALLLLLVLTSLPGRISFAQLENGGRVLGTVTDAQGSVVVGAVVQLTSGEHGQTSTVQTNARGEYLFVAVPVGTYSVTVRAATFAGFTAEAIAVDANQNIRVDARLSPGSVSEAVVVQGPETSVDTQSATIGVLIDPKLIEDVPIDGNNVVALAALLPGVTNVSAPTTFTNDTSGPSYNVNGSRNTENLFLLDGTIWNNLYYNTGLNYPPADALQEVSVLLNNFKAQYGRNVGSVFNAITRSGSNQFHGSLYEFMQNRVFNAADYLSKLNPKLVQNQFGATLGGPLLPGHVFFYLAYQDLRAAQTATAQAAGLTVEQRGLTATGAPEPCSSTGAFVGQNCATQLATQLENPLNPANTSASSVTAATALNAAYVQAGGVGTSPCVSELQAALTKYGHYIPNNELPYVCFNPVIQKVLQYVPPPNLPNGLTGTQAPSPKNDQNGLARVDIQVRKHQIDARYYATAVDDMLAKSVAVGTGVASYEIDHDTGGIRAGGLGDTWVIRANLLNVFRAAYKRYVFDVYPTDNTTLSDLGADFPTTSRVPALPYLNVNGLFSLGTSGHGYQHVVNENMEFTDTVSITHGNHNIQTGVDFLRLQYALTADYVPTFSFNQVYTLSYPGDFLLGLPQSESVGNLTERDGIQHVVYTYVQDDWRATPRLTLNVGLRYELPFEYFQPKDRNETFIPGYQSIVYPQAPPNLAFVGDPGVQRSLIPTRYNNVAPRFGFAYDPSGAGRTSFRGGFGLFYSATNALVIGVGEPFHYTANYVLPAGGISVPLLGLNAVPPDYNPASPQFTAPYSIFFPDKNFRAAYTEAFNLGVQRAVGHHGVFEVNYVVRLGKHQSIPLDLNPAIHDCSGAYFQLNPTLYCTAAAQTAVSYNARVVYPGFNYGGQGVVDYASVATSNYNGLQVFYTQRNLAGISIFSSFTYSKSLDEQSASTTVNNSTPQPWNIRTQYGPSDFNSKLNLTLGWATSASKLKLAKSWERTVLNGWKTSGTYTARTGSPFSVTLPSDSALTAEPNQRAALVPGANPLLPSNRHRSEKVLEWFNTAAFVVPPNPTGTYSSQSRNSFVGPGYIVLNSGLGRTFALPDMSRARLDFRVDAFNTFNTPNLSNPGSILPTYSCTLNPASANCTTGKILTTAGTNSSVGTNGRRLQVSLKLNY